MNGSSKEFTIDACDALARERPIEKFAAGAFWVLLTLYGFARILQVFPAHMPMLAIVVLHVLMGGSLHNHRDRFGLPLRHGCIRVRGVGAFDRSGNWRWQPPDHFALAQTAGDRQRLA
jgi:hypothetical protein